MEEFCVIILYSKIPLEKPVYQADVGLKSFGIGSKEYFFKTAASTCWHYVMLRSAISESI